VSTDRVPAESWVGPPDVHRELGLLLTRCVARADAATQLGPLLRGRLSQGVKALFIGASGTGKTLGAQWLADRLARPLVRVDLAAVVSKYIGETEKNLAQLLSRAEHLDAVLLFDEADSLFGARTDVKQANDRYANMQTNYLLQRLETFHGVAVLTSNSKARFDDAFLRRLDAVIEFPLPDVAERRALWSLHLGAAPDLDPAMLNAVAALVDLPGGHIRNAVLTAALLARQRQMNGDGTPGLHANDLREALALEYRKLGQRAPDSL
jgi:SpoVK/Ycf46/Vps4 family AAA+-type ATPase